MRIKTLHLKAFGPFSDRTLDFSAEIPGLHIVYGPNEAGKSSTMRALQALLFGFPARTRDDFIHSYSQMLVGGCLQADDGRELTFFRRKKNKHSLFDQEDKQLDSATLTPFLHGLDQELFTTLYGCNHETLVQGGQGLLDQQGAVGQALFAAGSGLASLKSIVDELEAEGDELFKPRGSSQAISVALARYKELQAAMKAVTLSSRDWQEHQRALDEAVMKLDDASRLSAALNKEKRQLERLNQALPYLGQRRALQEKLAELGDVVMLPSDFGERRRNLEQQGRDARRQLESMQGRLQDLKEKSMGVSVNEGFLEHAEAIDALHQGLGQYQKAKADRPALDGRRNVSRTEAAHLLQQIRPDIALDEIETLRPGLAKRKTVQALGAQHGALVQAERKAGRLVQTTADEFENARNDQNSRSRAADSSPLARSMGVAHKAGDLDQEITSRVQNLESTRSDCLAELQRLGLWSGSLHQLAALTVPLTETLHRFEEEFRSITDEKRQIHVDRSQLERERDQLVVHLHELENSSDVPAEEDLFNYRGRRDFGWQLLRRQWLQHEDVADESRTFDSENPLPEAYEKLVSVSDQTADRLYREADRVQKHASLKAQAEGAEKRLHELELREASVTTTLEGISRSWQELWEPCAIHPLPPREMLAWLNGLDVLRFQLHESDKLAREVEGCEARRRELRAMLLADLAALGEQRAFPGDELTPLLLFSDALLQRMQKDKAQSDKLDEKLVDLEAALRAARQEHEDARAELGHWHSLWCDALAPLGIATTTLPAEAIDFIETLQACFDKREEADVFRKRIDGIDRDACLFEAAVLALTNEIAQDLVSLDAPQIITQLKNRLGRAVQDQARLQHITHEMESLQQSCNDARSELDSFEEQTAALRRLAGCESEEQLIEAERRSREQQTLKDRLEELESNLLCIAEGISLAVLEEQARAVDPDDLPGKIDALATEIDGRLGPEIVHRSEIIGREKSELARMDGSGKASELADAAQETLAKIRRLTEQYIRIKLASKVLREEIERYRTENQDPVLNIASAYFSGLTLGGFAGLRTDINEHGQPVLIGVRSTGAWLHVEGMSSGTRDQLYLALRLATLEWRIQTSEPMPFVVDDILINFDDQRSKATLQALSRLAEKTQVILFTHHGQIFETARELGQPDRIFIHTL